MPPLQNLDWKLLDVAKPMLVPVLAEAGSGLRLNKHLEHDDGNLSSFTPASLASRALSASASGRAIGPAGRPTGLR
jgi:hypothetical protein